MDVFLVKLKKKFDNNDDFFLKQDRLNDHVVVLLGFHTLIDLTKTKLIIQQNITHHFTEPKNKDFQEAVSSILQGKLIVYLEHDKTYLIVGPIPQNINRAIESPHNETVLQGTILSFHEDIELNIGILRKQIHSDNLKMKAYLTGSNRAKKIAVVYLDGHVNKDLLAKVTVNIQQNLYQEINDLQSLTNMLGFSPWNAISKFYTTELPLEAIRFLQKGRVIIFIDRFPFAYVLPTLIWDMFILENDRNYPLHIMISIRTLRILGVLITLIIPGLYVALVAVNPEVLRIELALSIANSREGIPYPALVEIILMLIVLELILEASVRLPKSIGPTLTMVGGIILGQAVVDAKLVSNLLIIILAATTIANSTIVGYQNALSIRLFKYINVILSSIYGILGLLAGIVIIIAYFANLNTYGISYLYFDVKKDEIKHG